MGGTSTLNLSRLSLHATTSTERGLLGNTGQLHHVSTVRRTASSENVEAEASKSNALPHTRLFSPSRGLRFAPTPRMQAQHATSTASDPEPALQHVTKSGVPVQSSTDESPEHDRRETIQNAKEEADSALLETDLEASFETDIQSQEDSTRSISSDSDYVPSQEEESIANEQLLDEEQIEEEEYEAEEHIDLEYQIPEQTLRTAMLASEKTRASFFSAKMYRGPDDQALSTHYCKTKEVAERVCQHFLKEKVLGFDIEWKPWSSESNIKQNASLIQLACEDRIALFHISQFRGTTAEELMPPTLKTILESPDILKVGVAVKGDFTRLNKFLNVQPQGVFELSRLHNLVQWHATEPKKVTNKLVGLAAQVLQHLQLPLYKGEQLADDPEGTASVRESDWSKPLDLQQIQYAATDAYAGFRLYHLLEWKRKQMRPTPPTRGICDYDSKPAPRPKVPKKEIAKKTKDASAASTEASAAAVAQARDAEPEKEALEGEDGEEEEGYETASEEFMDSHELEDPISASTNVDQSQGTNDSVTINEKAPAQKRVGRVNLAWLRGPDPQYPTLPRQPDDGDALMDTPADADAMEHEVVHPADTEKDDDDEFADPELEEAFQDLDLDEDGKLRDVSVSATKVVHPSVSGLVDTASKRKEAKKKKRVDNLPQPEPEPSKEEEWTEESDTDMSDYEIVNSEAEEPVVSTLPSNESPTTTAAEPSHYPEYNSATDWARTYLQSTIPSPTFTTPSRIRATIPHLRAYHLWYHQSLTLDDIASHLRDPPLSHSTVIGYILQAVTLEKLDYDEDRMRGMMLGLPVGLRKGRWKWMAEKVGAAK
jgi:hypothetical protein